MSDHEHRVKFSSGGVCVDCGEDVAAAERRERLEREAYLARVAWEAMQELIESQTRVARKMFTVMHNAECALGHDMGYDWPVQGNPERVS